MWRGHSALCREWGQAAMPDMYHVSALKKVLAAKQAVEAAALLVFGCNQK